MELFVAVLTIVGSLVAAYFGATWGSKSDRLSYREQVLIGDLKELFECITELNAEYQNLLAGNGGMMPTGKAISIALRTNDKPLIDLANELRLHFGYVIDPPQDPKQVRDDKRNLQNAIVELTKRTVLIHHHGISAVQPDLVIEKNDDRKLWTSVGDWNYLAYGLLAGMTVAMIGALIYVLAID